MFAIGKNTFLKPVIKNGPRCTTHNLGLVITQGAMESYAVANTGIIGGDRASGAIGTLVLNIPVIALKANETYTVQWILFWHKGRNDFCAISKKIGLCEIGCS